jgi:hypothetical protein
MTVIIFEGNGMYTVTPHGLGLESCCTVIGQLVSISKTTSQFN